MLNKRNNCLLKNSGFSMVEILVAMAIMTVTALLSYKQITSVTSIENSFLRDFDIRELDHRIDQLIKEKLSCSYGIKDLAGNNALHSLTDADLEIQSIEKIIW